MTSLHSTMVTPSDSVRTLEGRVKIYFEDYIDVNKFLFFNSFFIVWFGWVGLFMTFSTYVLHYLYLFLPD